MKSAIAAIDRKELVKSVILDLFALAFIYFVPSLAHLTGFPVYMIEPMRLMLILSIVHSTKNNTYLLALTLPVFSLAVSGHPEFLKMLIITGELILNGVLFYLIRDRFKNVFISLISAIILSKLACYLAYWVIFSFAFVKSEAGGTFLAAQCITTLLFSSYAYLVLTNKQRVISNK
jgi:hypothetical protein